MILQSEEKIIADFEIGITSDCIFHNEMYAYGMMGIYKTFLNSNLSCGILVSDAIVEEDRNRYERNIEMISNKILNDHKYRVSLIKSGYQQLNNLNMLTNLLIRKETYDLKITDVTKLIEKLIPCMSYIAFNWCIPFEDVLDRFCSYFTLEESKDLINNFSIPKHISHFRLMNIGLTKFSLDYLENKEVNYERFKDIFGCLETSFVYDSKLETNVGIMDEVQSILIQCDQNKTGLEKRLKDLSEIRVRTSINKNILLTFMYHRLLSEKLDIKCIEEYSSILKLLEFVNDQEEMRHILQMRIQRIIKKFCFFNDISLEDFRIKSMIGL